MAIYFHFLQKCGSGYQNLFQCYKQIVCPVIFLFVSTCSFSQSANYDSIPPSLDSLYQQYMSRMGGSAHLYNGAEYEGAYRNTLGTPFWNNNDFQRGSIMYEGIVYDNVPIAFDLIRNEVLTQSFQEVIIRLESTKLNAFRLNGHTFISVHNDTTRFNPLPDDIYDLLLNSQTIKVFAKRTKNTRRSFRSENKDTIVSRVRYYIKYGNTNYPVGSTKDLTRIFPESKNRLTAFWKENHLRFKKDPEPFIIQTVRFWLQEKK